MMMLLLALLFSQEKLDAKGTLEAAAAALKDAGALSFEVVHTRSWWKEPLRGKCVLKRPNLVRYDRDDELFILDGSAFWAMTKASDAYRKRKQEKDDAADYAPGPLGWLFFEGGCKGLLELRGSEGLAVADEKLGDVPCKAVGGGEKQSKLRWKIWIDAKNQVLQSSWFDGDTEVDRMTFRSLDLAPKPAKDAFTFTPPGGAVESVDGGKLPWRQGVKEAMVEARREGMAMMLYFTSEG